MLTSDLLSRTSFGTYSVFIRLLVDPVPYIHTYERVRHRPPIDYLCTCSCSWMGSHVWHFLLTFLVLELYLW